MGARMVPATFNRNPGPGFGGQYLLHHFCGMLKLGISGKRDQEGKQTQDRRGPKPRSPAFGLALSLSLVCSVHACLCRLCGQRWQDIRHQLREGEYTNNAFTTDCASRHCRWGLVQEGRKVGMVLWDICLRSALSKCCYR